MLLRTLLFLSLSLNLFAAEVFESADWHREVHGTPLDVAAGRVLEAYFEFTGTGLELDEVLTPSDLYDSRKNWEAAAARLADHILEENLAQSFSRYWQQADEVHRAALRPAVRDVRAALNALILHQGDQGFSRSPALMFPRYEPLASYEYAYGKELSRDVVDKFESIHRQTFFENRTHEIDIDLDFLEPIREVIEALKLKGMFEWLWNSKLFYGYHSSFKHHKKVFIRFKAFNQKVAVEVEILRRKRHWWGYGDWEVYGSTTQMKEEPTAIVGREVQELD